MVAGLLALLLFLYGLAIGSFLNVVIDRVPQSKSLIKPRSYCDSCGKTLGWADLIPLLSFLWLRRRCRYCHSLIPWRVFWVELGSGIFPVAIFWWYGLSPLFVFTLFWGLVFITLGLIDVETQLVPDIIVYPAILLAVITTPFWHSGWREVLVGGAVGFGALFLPAVLSRGGMGWGDVKIAALMGILTGFPSILVGLGTALISGGISGGLFLLLKYKSRKEPIPFVPFLVLGLFVAFFWGERIWGWYRNSFLI